MKLLKNLLFWKNKQVTPKTLPIPEISINVDKENREKCIQEQILKDFDCEGWVVKESDFNYSTLDFFYIENKSFEYQIQYSRKKDSGKIYEIGLYKPYNLIDFTTEFQIKLSLKLNKILDDFNKNEKIRKENEKNLRLKKYFPSCFK